MSVKISTLVWEIALPSLPAKILALKLADCASDLGDNIFPAFDTVMAETGLARSTLYKWLAVFQRSGLVSVKANDHGYEHRAFDVAILRALARGDLVVVEGRDEAGETVWSYVAPDADVAIETTGDDSPRGGLISERTSPRGGLPSPCGGLPSPRGGLHIENVNLTSIEHSPLPPDGGLGAGSAQPVDQQGKTSGRQRRAGRSSDQAVEEMLERIALVPSREAAVDRLLRPVALRKHFDAPAVEHTLSAVADWIAVQGLTDAEMGAAADLLLDGRRVKFTEAAVRDAVAKVLAGRSSADAAKDPAKPKPVLITRVTHPAEADAWIVHLRATGRRQDAALLEKHGLYVPSLQPPPSHIASTGAAS